MVLFFTKYCIIIMAKTGNILLGLAAAALIVGGFHYGMKGKKARDARKNRVPGQGDEDFQIDLSSGEQKKPPVVPVEPQKNRTTELSQPSAITAQEARTLPGGVAANTNSQIGR